MTSKEQLLDSFGIQLVKRISPVPWQHVNFYGHYQFDADFTPLDFKRLHQQLSSEEVSRLYARADRIDGLGEKPQFASS